MKYVWIREHCDQFPVKTMCRVLGVSTSGYYAARKRRVGPRALRSQRIRDHVVRVYQSSNQIYGSYKIAKELRKDSELESACRNTVARAMNELGLKSRVSRRFRPATTVADPTGKPAENILDQNFKANAPNVKWVTDITYLPVAGGWVYLAVVLDLFSRRIVGWALSESLATPLVSRALRTAIEQRRPVTRDLLLHSDRGCQYTSEEYQGQLKTMSITCSMSRTGCCYDNAVAERFFWSLKQEWLNFRELADLEAARHCVFEYIELFYNTKRIHQTLGYQSPKQFEENHYAKLSA